MPIDPTTPNKYTQVIDLTTSAQREKRQKRQQEQFEKPENQLAETSLDELPDLVQQAARAAGWSELMEVQRKALPYIIDERDLIVQSRTGSGKTGAFLLPLFDKLNPKQKEVQALRLYIDQVEAQADESTRMVDSLINELERTRTQAQFARQTVIRNVMIEHDLSHTEAETIVDLMSGLLDVGVSSYVMGDLKAAMEQALVEIEEARQAEAS